jgi:tRNA (cytidine/uridine-2'-O-)-methyltransferase
LTSCELHLVLVAPEIHWNTGNVGRTALAVDAELHLVEPLGFSLDDKHVKRAGLDYWPRVRLRVWRDWESLERELPSLGEPWLFTSGNDDVATRDYWDADFGARNVLVFGRESVGLPRELIAKYPGRALRIPMADRQLRSLNLSTAAALAAYEVRRRSPAWRR